MSRKARECSRLGHDLGRDVAGDDAAEEAVLARGGAHAPNLDAPTVGGLCHDARMTPDHHEQATDTDAFRGATFRRVDLAGASLREVDLSGATIRDSDVTRAAHRRLGGRRGGLSTATRGWAGSSSTTSRSPSYVRAELDRRHPERVLVREMRTVEEVRRAWAVVDAQWDDAVAHAATLPEPLLHERVEGEWSFVETMRHLVFACDIWVGRMLSDEPGDFHPLGLPPTDTTDAGAAAMGLTLDATPSFDEVEALHRERARAVRRDCSPRVTDADLRDGAHRRALARLGRGVVPRVRVPARSWSREHAEHLRFALRDLATLEQRSAPA